MEFIDLFAGIGGFRLGLEKVGQFQQSMERPKKSRGIKSIGGKPQFTCVYSNEWDKYARQIYKGHFGECDGRDIREVPMEEIPNHDLLCAGFPCQSFSIAGQRKGFQDTRGTLFFEICRVLKDKRPSYLLLENVKGLLSHQDGWTFATMLLSLDELGYDVEWQVLNSKHFGVPQNRERVFIVGHLRRTSAEKIFPIQANDEISDEAYEESENITQALTATDYKGVSKQRSNVVLDYVGAIMTEANKRRLNDGKDLSREFPQGQRVYSTHGIATTLASQAGGLGAKTGLYAVLTPDRPKKRQHGRRFKENGEPSFTLTGQDIHGVSDGLRIRRLTPLECERLQGFPDNWTEGVSDTQRYKMLGNAVTVNVIEAIGRKWEWF